MRERSRKKEVRVFVMKKENRKLIPPDGGWGWMVCLGNSFVTLSLRSVDPSFGLLFGDLLKDLKVETTGASVIMSVLETVLNLSGIFVGPLIKRFTCRKVAIFGSLLSCTGLILTSQANSLTYIICTYSILGGFGTGLALTASFVPLNSYFKKRRTQVVGLAMTGTTVGMMFMPQIVRLLLNKYDFRGTVLIIGAMALHSVLGSCLLQPVSWHMKPAPDEKDLKSVSKASIDEKDALLKTKENLEDKKLRRVSVRSNTSEMSSIDLTQSDRKNEKNTQEILNSDENGNKRKAKNSLASKFVSCFDLKLLTDPIYLNIILYLSICYEAEITLKVIMPFFLTSIGMTKADVAFSLSLLGFSDLLARLTMPTIFTKLKLKNRNAFWIGTTLLCINRSILAELMPGKLQILVLLVIGFLRGISMINFNLTVSEHCSLDVLPSALGILNVVKGLFIVALGPIMGYIRDTTGSYKICIHIMTSLILLYSAIWGIESVVRKIHRLKNFSEKGSKHLVA